MDTPKSRLGKLNSRKLSKRPKRVPLPPISMGITVTENLPFPIVQYPEHYGSFITFSRDYESQSYLCSCAQPAVENYLRLCTTHYGKPSLEEYSNNAVDEYLFPKGFIKYLRQMTTQNSSLEYLFSPNLCHRCNMKTPSVRWCHEIYGVTFVQYYGWYINQTYLRLGILPLKPHFPYLEQVCPVEIQQDIKDLNIASEILSQEYSRIMKSVNDPKHSSLQGDQDTSTNGNNQAEVGSYVSLQREVSRCSRKLSTKIENLTRTEFGFKKIGEGWVSETILYNIIANIYPTQSVLRHFHPDWLSGLELDIFIQENKLAFEYQGQQHYHAIKAWGGEQALLALQDVIERKQ